MESDIVQFVPLRKFHSRSGANFSLVNLKKLYIHKWNEELNIFIIAILRLEKHLPKYQINFLVLWRNNTSNQTLHHWENRKHHLVFHKVIHYYNSILGTNLYCGWTNLFTMKGHFGTIEVSLVWRCPYTAWLPAF